MLKVIECAELQCIHYRGTAPEIITRLKKIGAVAVCDTPFPRKGRAQTTLVEVLVNLEHGVARPHWDVLTVTPHYLHGVLQVVI
jgi:hypothetical protein